MTGYRLYVMLAWAPELGSFVDPVGVLGVAEDGSRHVSWMPLSYERVRPWQRRMLGPVSAERIEAWLAAGWLADADPPPETVPMADAVEGLLDQLVVEVIPVVRSRRW